MFYVHLYVMVAVKWYLPLKSVASQILKEAGLHDGELTTQKWMRPVMRVFPAVNHLAASLSEF